MPNEQRPLKVFLCHAHSDAAAVHHLYDRLKKDGVDVWLDKESLLPGQNWRTEIQKAVVNADAVIVCHSKEFNQKGFRQREVKWSLDAAMDQPPGEIFIIPARLEDCDVLEILSDWHWVDLFEDEGYSTLMRALYVRAEKVGAALQLRNSWLHKAITSRKNEKPVLEKKPAEARRAHVQVEEERRVTNDLELEKQKSQKPHAQRRMNKTIIVALIGFAGTILAGLLSSPLVKNWFSATEVPTNSVVTETADVNILASQTDFTSNANVTSQKIFTPSFTPVESLTFSPSSLPTSISSSTPMPFDPYPDVSDHNDAGVAMRLVPAGEFIMGVESDYPSDNSPAHVVYLGAFYIDKYEVTNLQYQICVDHGPCQPPKDTSSTSHREYFSNSRYNTYPVLNVDWNMAKTYCEWRGGSLPSETEWEKAARGTDARNYPWGNVFAYDGPNTTDVRAIGSYKEDKSPYGVYDMAYNAAEWSADWYDVYPGGDPKSASSQWEFGEIYRIVRGSSWSSMGDSSRYVQPITHRLGFSPSEAGKSISFRCVRPVGNATETPPPKLTLTISPIPTATAPFTVSCNWISGKREDQCVCNLTDCACYLDWNRNDGFQTESGNYYKVSRYWVNQRMQEYGGKCH